MIGQLPKSKEFVLVLTKTEYNLFKSHYKYVYGVHTKLLNDIAFYERERHLLIQTKKTTKMFDTIAKKIEKKVENLGGGFYTSKVKQGPKLPKRYKILIRVYQ